MVSDALANGASVEGRGDAFPVTDSLRLYLATLMGSRGVHALLVRALALATRDAPWLSAATVSSDGDLEGLAEIGSVVGPAELLEGRVALLAQLLGLLVVFIGPSLTSRLVGEFWPEIPFRDRDFGQDGDLGKEHADEEAH
jgi:hypothetical protein